MSTVSLLKKLYAQFSFATKDMAARCTALIQAVGIMDQVCGTLKAQSRLNPALVPAEFDKYWEKARKCRARALGTTFEPEKETSLRMCLKFMERMAENLKGVPKLDEYILKLEAKQKVEAEKEAKAKAKAAGKTAKPKVAPTQAPSTPGATPAPKAPKPQSGLPPLDANGVPMWRAGSSAAICCTVLMAQPTILHEDAVNAVKGQFQSSNYDNRIAVIAAELVKLNKIKRVKLNGKPAYERL